MQKHLHTSRLALALCAGLASTAPLAAQPFGQWDFNQSNLVATVGADLSYRDGDFGATAAGTQFGTTTSFGIPDIAGTPAGVMRFPASDMSALMGYNLTAPFSPNGGGSLVNDYTLILDVLFPAGSANKVRPLLETDQQILTPEADLIVDAGNGIGGVPGPYHGTLAPDTWYRVGFVMDTTARQLRKYINGVEAGVQSIPSVDSKFALTPGGWQALFANSTAATSAEGYVNSLQLRDTVLTPAQMVALGGPAAAGVPEVIPSVPSYVQSWTPAAAVANRTTPIGAVINPGDTTVNTNTIVLKLNGVAQSGLQITSNGVIAVAKSSVGPLSAGTMQTIEVTYTDGNGVQSHSKSFKAAFLFEDFEGLTLLDAVEEPNGMTNAWTPAPPVGWVTNHSGMPGYGDPANDGRTEWAGWTFAKKDFWIASDNQTRDNFTRGTGTLAIADPDEWDDAAHPQFDANTNALYFNSFLATPSINVAGALPSSIFLKFDSSWRPEGFDDWGGTNNQTATVTVSYNGGAPIEVLRWDSQAGGPYFKPDTQNEAVFLPLANPVGVTTMVVTFGMTRAANDWWWAFDNLEVNTGPVAPAITLQPLSQTVSTNATVVFTTAASGSAPFSYQWQFHGTNLPGQTQQSLTLAGVQTANAGPYRVVVSNEGGSATSAMAWLNVYATVPAEGLVTHLKFEDNYDDASGRGNNAFPVNSPAFQSGFLGRAAYLNSSRTNDPNNYVSLGYPTDLLFGSEPAADAVNASFAFWTKVYSRSGDKPFISNKDWDSGSNRGWVLASVGGGMKWNLRDDQSARRDSPGVGPQINDGGWHHIVVTFERTNYARIYVDGVLADVTSMAPDAGKPVGSLDTAGLGLNINLCQDGAGDYTDGSSSGLEAAFDDFGIWRRVITPQEVEAIYHAAFFGTPLDSAPLYGPVPPPQITFAPTNQTVTVGSPVAIAVSAIGGNPLSYQWRLAGANLPAATGSTFAIASADSTNAGNYTVVVSNPGGSVTSSVAVLTVISAPIITAQPVSRTNNQNLDVTFSVTASGGGLMYQWLSNGTNLPGATNATLSLPSIVPAQAGTYAVQVSNTGGSVTSSNALLTVLPVPAPRITGQWDFNQGDLRATTGQALEFFNATAEADTTFGTTTSFGIADIGGEPAGVLRYVPSAANWGGYNLSHGAAPNGGGSYVNQYTIICDVYYPPTSHNRWRALLQTASGNNNDGDFFINAANGVGISGNYQGSVLPATWTRIALAVDVSSPLSPAVAKWINGVKVGYQTGLSGGKDGRFSLNPVALLFADNDGENAETFVSSVQFWNGKLPDAMLATMGTPTAAKIPGAITATRVPGAIAIYRTGNLGVEVADSLNGPWAEVTGAANPLIVPATGAAKFYRPKF
jgi:hypothetical protein